MKRLLFTLLGVVYALGVMAAEKSTVIAYINGTKYYIHTVQQGETLYSLSKLYAVSEQTIVQCNPILSEGLKMEQNIKIPFIAESPNLQSERKLRKTFDFHFVTKGETLYAISRQYEIPIPTIIQDNPNLNPIQLRLGERILIRKKKIGSEEEEAETQAHWEGYRQQLNSVAERGSAYHIVQSGETFYSLSRRFGISEEMLSQMNNGLKAMDLKAGAMICVPSQNTPEERVVVAEQGSADTPLQPAVEVTFRALKRTQPLRVALMLPMAVQGKANPNYLEFYQGFLMGLDSIKRQGGYSIQLDLYNTARDSAKIAQIVQSEEFAGTNLIVGPVYEEGLSSVVRFAEEHQIPVVSPLAHIAKTQSDALFQLAPLAEHKWDKVADLLGSERRITLVYTDRIDREFEQEVLSLLGNRPYQRHLYQYEHHSIIEKEKEKLEAGKEAKISPSDMTPFLQNKEENLFIILADNEVDVDRIMAALASAQTSLVSRGATPPRYKVLGNPRWNRFQNLDRAMFFKNSVIFISSYHAKRDGEAVRRFDSDYIRSFGTLPTLYSYRGFDSAILFVPAMYGDIEYEMEDRRYTPLQSSYRFKQQEGSLNHVNTNWTRVNYHPNFTITID